MKSNKEKIISNFKQRIEQIGPINEVENPLTERQVATLLGELQIAQLELEMQNDELSISAEMLETERAKFADFFNLAPIGYFILDYLGMVIEANQIGLQLLCQERSAILNQRFQSFIAPEDLEKFYSFLHKMKPNGIKQAAEIRIQLLDRDCIYTKMEGMAIENSFANLISYYVTVTDITESIMAQQKLQVATERLKMSLSASGTGTWSINLAENRIFLDEFSLSLLEVHSWEFDGSLKKFIEFVYPEDQLMVKRHLLNDVSRLEKIDVEFRILTKDKQIKYLAIKGHHIQTQLGTQLPIGIILDVTERKKNAMAKQELQNEKQKLILATTLKAQENERYKISSALHDSICQLLYGIRLNLQNIPSKGSINTELTIVNQLLNQAIKETRELSYELTPSVLRDFGLVEGIREMAQRLSSKNFHITTKLKRTSDLLSNELQLSIFRIIQELLNNCIKHANATRAEIIVCTEKGMVNIIMRDNGKGFKDDIEILMTKGFGLRGIRNRIFLLEGKLDFSSSSKGTKIAISFKNK